jgi:hypothetical protein
VLTSGIGGGLEVSEARRELATPAAPAQSGTAAVDVVGVHL